MPTDSYLKLTQRLTGATEYSSNELGPYGQRYITQGSCAVSINNPQK